ncbi:unnamed protein product [Auanema sp. JU1783]|nr:unnamed protein product [Auanema sp. JU1783]
MLHASIAFILQFILIFQIKLANGEDLLQDRSVACTASTMDVSLSFSKGFSGSIFTEKGFSNPSCRWSGKGDTNMDLKIPLMSNTTDCGVASNETNGEFTVKLIISPVEGLIVDGFSAINIRCIYSTQDITLTLPPGLNGNALQISGTHAEAGGVVTGSGGAPILSMQILDGHGINGQPVARAAVGQRITLDLVLKDTSIYDFYVHSCYAHDGTNTPDASINIVDNNGCGVRLSRAIDVPAFTTEPANHGPKHVYLHMYGFQFTSSQFVHFECQVKPCVHSCHREQCEPEKEENKIPLIPAARRRRQQHEDNLKTLRLQTVLHIEEQQFQKAALVSAEEPAATSACLQVNSVLFICLFFALAIISIVTTGMPSATALGSNVADPPRGQPPSYNEVVLGVSPQMSSNCHSLYQSYYLPDNVTVTRCRPRRTFFFQRQISGRQWCLIFTAFFIPPIIITIILMCTVFTM